MKVISRMIRRTIIEIIVVIAFVFISIPIWKSFNLDNYASVAMYYENNGNNQLEVTGLDNYTLYQTSDKQALANVKPINLSVSNSGKMIDDYAVWMVVSKKSTIDFNSIRISVSDEAHSLTDLEMVEGTDEYYFMLFEGNQTEKCINKEVKLWLDIECKSDNANSILEFDFENIQRQIL